jgi:hypothetical protein
MARQEEVGKIKSIITPVEYSHFMSRASQFNGARRAEDYLSESLLLSEAKNDSLLEVLLTLESQRKKQGQVMTLLHKKEAR